MYMSVLYKRLQKSRYEVESIAILKFLIVFAIAVVAFFCPRIRHKD